jgi:Xaa-Pro aminopeptidase
MCWVQRTVRERQITEIEAADRLVALRAEHPECQASLPSLSASGASGALPHYIPKRENCRRLNDHPLYWMDSGGQYWGGTTDTTVALALGTPEPTHFLAHTWVLQGHIAVATARFPVGTCGLRIDTLARAPLWAAGVDFDHNTGHGVGNFLNVHEGPSIGREPGPTTLMPLEPGMIVTNEPGYYAAGDFGLRIEREMTVVESRYPGFLEFETISRVPMEPKLIDFDCLSPVEKRWLTEYHHTVLQDLEPRLDSVSAAWLRALVDEMDVGGRRV